MAKINVLDSKTFNKIAAGEVVERPSSVVKELVENSIDAGAKNIKIEIEDGGISLIKITDDGCGIEKDDLPKTILAHATSKLSTIEDLEKIATLGFRGEALASIASVSKLTITSKTADDENGTSLYAEGGADINITDCSSTVGTEITVANLFFNVPARQKFLKTIRSEESEVTNIVFRLILAYPNVSFKYIVDKKTVYHSFGDGFDGAMLAVYGLQVINDCFYIDTIKNGLHIYGYIGKHYFTKGNKTHQSLFINGRYVINSTTSSAIMNAYSTYLMKRQYPFYVLNIDLPPEIVDVNVHPTKSDVRFSNNQIVYGSLYSVISSVLNGTSEALNIVKDNIKTDTVDADEIEVKINQISANEEVKTATSFDAQLFDSAFEPNRSALSNEIDYSEKKKYEKDQKYEDIFAENKAYLEQLSLKNKKAEEEQKIISVQQEINTCVNLEYVGQALNTYLILQDEKDIYFVDQHAAHERILYDKLLDAKNSGAVAVQPLLLPFVITFTGIEANFLFSKLPYVKQFGIEIEEFGKNSFKISALPIDLIDMDLDAFFNEIVGDMANLSDDKLPEIITDKIAQKACKSAIKAGHKLVDDEIQTLLKMLKGDMGLKCPHGRPVAVKITRTEIDKWFKRIV